MMSDSSSESTYIFDAEQVDELTRLIQQGQALTKAAGGPLGGIDEAVIKQWHTVLDLGCGPGDWTLDVAFAHPDIKVTGIDISKTMIDYARARATSQQLTNVSFSLMDITKPLDFADASFDLVNARFLVAVLYRDAWLPFLKECTRILRPGGLLRLTEPIDLGLTSSPAYETLNNWVLQLYWKHGYSFSVNGKSIGITHTLPYFLRSAGYLNVRQIGYALDFSADMESAWSLMRDNASIGMKKACDLFVQAGFASSDEVNALYNQMMIEFYAEDFHGVWHYATIQGEKPA
ncbi:MAG TPA: methyltransferase domain-containing protein [Ktedonobacteraceae bacterium]